MSSKTPYVDFERKLKHHVITHSEEEYNILKSITVSPWDVEIPALSIPEKPAVILEVLNVNDDSTIDAGLKDVFGSICLVSSLSVDEALNVGNRIVVRGTGYQAEIVNPEYDGVAYGNCDTSLLDEIRELSYTFDYEMEFQSHSVAYRDAWLDSLWPEPKKGQLETLYAKYETIRNAKYEAERNVQQPVLAQPDDKKSKYPLLKSGVSGEYFTLLNRMNNTSLTHTQEEMYQKRVEAIEHEVQEEQDVFSLAKGDEYESDEYWKRFDQYYKLAIGEK